MENKNKRIIGLIIISIFICSCGNNNKIKDNANDELWSAIENDTISKDSLSESTSNVCMGTHKQIADKYIDTITGFTCVKAMLTDNDFLIVAIDAVSDSNYDFLASQFLDEAKSEGLTWIKGVRIVDSKNCEFQQGTVVGDRIGEAYNN